MAGRFSQIYADNIIIHKFEDPDNLRLSATGGLICVQKRKFLCYSITKGLDILPVAYYECLRKLTIMTRKEMKSVRRKKAELSSLR